MKNKMQISNATTSKEIYMVNSNTTTPSTPILHFISSFISFHPSSFLDAIFDSKGGVAVPFSP